MTLFVSYTKSDDAVVRTVRADLEQLGHDVWMDHQIHGGESWWREIIREIQNADIFVFALSKNSWKSKPCRLELDYATALELPVLPLQVGPLDHMYIPLAERQIIDCRERTADSMVKLVTALAEMSSRQIVRPDPLPEPPPVPFEYLYRIASVMGPDRIAPERQEELIGTLRRKLREEDDQLARADIVKLLQELKNRNEITVPNAREVDEILASVTTAPAPADGATRLPPADHWRKAEAANGGAERTRTTEERATEPPPAAGAEAPHGGGATTGQVPAPTAGPARGTGSTPGTPGGVEASAGTGATTGQMPASTTGPASGDAPTAGHAPGSTGAAEPGVRAETQVGPQPTTTPKPAPTAGQTPRWPGGAPGSTTGTAAGTQSAANETATGAVPGGAPSWLVDLVRAEPSVREQVRPRPAPEGDVHGPQGAAWWTQPLPTAGGSPSTPGGQPSPVPPRAENERKPRFGPLGAGLGVVGILFLVVAVAAGGARFPLLAIAALLVGVLGLTFGAVAVTRQEPSARAAAVVAAAGLAGALVYVAATWF